MRTLGFAIWALALSAGVSPAAEVRPGPDAAALVRDVSTAFLEILPRNDLGAELPFYSPALTDLTQAREWNTSRDAIAALTGTDWEPTAHALAFYDEDVLYAAVDFHAATGDPDVYLCGYLIWALPAPGRIALQRIEQNVVPLSEMRSAHPQAVAQTLTEFRCPPLLIQAVLDRLSAI